MSSILLTFLCFFSLNILAFCFICRNNFFIIADASNITKNSAGKFYPIGTGPRDVSIGITVAYIAVGPNQNY